MLRCPCPLTSRLAVAARPVRSKGKRARISTLGVATCTGSRMAKNPSPHSVANSTRSASLCRLNNLGPTSAQFLVRAGITSHEQLAQLGAVKAYAMVKRLEPRASLNLLWALEGALSGLHWQEVAKKHRTSLLLALETYEDANSGRSDGQGGRGSGRRRRE